MSNDQSQHTTEQEQQASNAAKTQATQELLIQQQVCIEKIKQVEQHLQQFSQHEQSLSNTITALDQMPQTEEGTEILVPLADGIYVKATLKDNKHVIMNVGAETNVQKTFEAAAQMVKEQTIELGSMMKNLEEEHHKLMQQLQDIQGQIQNV